MEKYSLAHLPDLELLQDLDAFIASERASTAGLLARIAEVDARRLYLPAGYPSMFAYCVEKLHLSEDAASKRIQAARAARRFPALFGALAEGRLHLTSVGLLAPHLTAENLEDLVQSATHKTKAKIEEILAGRFPRPELADRIRALPKPCPPAPPAPLELAPVSQHAPAHVGAPLPPPRPAKVVPVSAERFAMQLTMGRRTRDKLRYAQELLSHQVASKDLEAVLDMALDALIPLLEKARFAATDRPSTPRPASSSRHIPSHVKRAVWRRDGGQCAFVAEDGHRCSSRLFLEFDHADPVARGGQGTVDNVRLRCRAHNQYAAERTFGAEFMHRKRAVALGAGG